MKIMMMTIISGPVSTPTFNFIADHLHVMEERQKDRQSGRPLEMRKRMNEGLIVL